MYKEIFNCSMSNIYNYYRMQVKYIMYYKYEHIPFIIYSSYRGGDKYLILEFLILLGKVLLCFINILYAREIKENVKNIF